MEKEKVIKHEYKGNTIHVPVLSLIDRINLDLAKKYFSNFPKVKDQMERILMKLLKLKSIVNAQPLSSDDIKLLIDNDYLKDSTIVHRSYRK